MAEPSSWRPVPSESDGPPRPPTFVQIRPPAAPGGAGRKLGLLGVGLALVSALGWAGWRATGAGDAPVPPPAAPALADAPAPPRVPADLYDRLAHRAVDTAAAEPVWSRESLIDRVSPFDPSAADRAPSAAPPADATRDGPFAISVRLAKGETIGGALQKQGFAPDAITEVVSVLGRQIRLTRLPVGLDMTVQVQPPADGAGKPILQALTLHPEGRGEIKVERGGDGNYVVERSSR